LRDVYGSNRPALQDILRRGGAAAMTTGPKDAEPFLTMVAGSYVTPRAAAREPEAELPSAVRLIVEPAFRPESADAVLQRAVRAYPAVPVVALHPEAAPSPRGTASSLTLPSWLGVSYRHGRLASDTTRTPGVVSNLDVAPTLAALCGVPPPKGASGHVIGLAPFSRMLRGGLPAHVAAAVRWQEATRVIGVATNPVNFAIGFGGAALLMLAAAGLAMGRIRRPAARRRWQSAMLLPLTASCAVALAARPLPTTAEGYYLMAAAFTLIAWLAVMFAGRAMAASEDDVPLARLQLATGGVAVFIAVDVARHGIALRLSPLSSFYLTGIRFYGLGNEYTAVFLACVVISGMLAVQRAGADRLRWGGLAALGAWFALAGAVVSLPTLGADFGGLLAAAVTCGVAWRLAAKRSGARFAALYAIAVAAGLSAYVLYADTHSARATHVGHFVKTAGKGGWQAMLASKAGISLHLMTAAPAFAFYALALVFAILLRGPLKPVWTRVQSRYPWLVAGSNACLIGGIAAAALNDTGIVMLGLMVVVALGAAITAALQPAGLEMA
jgi:hypothetical protein